MRTCAGILQIGGMILGILGIIGGFITLITPAPSYGSYSTGTATNFGLGVAAIVASVVTWIVLYAFGALLDAVADIRDHAFRSAEANDRAADALEALVNRQRPRTTQATTDGSPEAPSIPAPPAPRRSATVVNRLTNRS